jgi:hypothetical protein
MRDTVLSAGKTAGKSRPPAGKNLPGMADHLLKPVGPLLIQTFIKLSQKAAEKSINCPDVRTFIKTAGMLCPGCLIQIFYYVCP